MQAAGMHALPITPAKCNAPPPHGWGRVVLPGVIDAAGYSHGGASGSGGGSRCGRSQRRMASSC